MTIDLSTMTRRVQPAVILTSVRKLLQQVAVKRRPARERRWMNG